MSELIIESDAALFEAEVDRRETARAEKKAAEKAEKAKVEAAKEEDSKEGDGTAEEKTEEKAEEKAEEKTEAMDEEELAPIVLTDEEKRAIVMKARAAAYDVLLAEKAAIERYEDDISRRYFHIKPLAQGEMRAWTEYLTYMEKRASKDSLSLARTIKTFERCLVSAAIYPQFWIRYSKFLVKHGMVEEARASLVTATSNYCRKKSKVFIAYAAFEEIHGGNIQLARELLQKVITRLSCGDVSVVLLGVNLERRHAVNSDYSKAESVFTNALEDCYKISVKPGEESKRILRRKPQFAKISLNFAQFLRVVSLDDKKAEAVLRKALEEDATNPTVWISLIDLLSRSSDVAAVSAEYELAIKAVPHVEMNGLLWQQYKTYMQTYATDVAEITEVENRAPQAQVPQNKKRKFQNNNSNNHGRRHSGHSGYSGGHGQQRRRHY